MLPARHRMRRAADFERAVRRGARGGRGSLVVHVADDPVEGGTPLVGLVVSKAVGNAVVRNRVKRRLRAVVSHRIDQLPSGGRLVVRALPGSGEAGSAELARDFEGAFATARRRLARTGRSTRHVPGCAAGAADVHGAETSDARPGQ
ncbi:ribonuclease P protein component [Cellulomonas fimi]|uniref:Ribonuclease P protein component n=1 Tax=Cellulomonas fimi TaxID=1708 RepID=A0A7Y0QHL8_CELFI|nr:ribonuclease P protein component [Cellulomonas fimi]NMR20430.1 ribonuclease P protein component [Cellulomonas fimi]